MSLDHRLKKLESNFCPECRRPLNSMQSSDTINTIKIIEVVRPDGNSLDISKLTVDQKRDLYERLHRDKYPNQLNLEEFRNLPVDEKSRVLRTDTPSAW